MNKLHDLQDPEIAKLEDERRRRISIDKFGNTQPPPSFDHYREDYHIDKPTLAYDLGVGVRVDKSSSMTMEIPPPKLTAQPNIVPEHYSKGYIAQNVDDKYKELHKKFLDVLETKNSWGKNMAKEAFLTVMAGLDYEG